MCGRFTLYDLSKFNINIKNEFKPNFNISPGSSILILNENKLPLIINWGITANWSEKVKIFNSRSETLMVKKSFNNTKRCIFLANGYYEWKRIGQNKIPFYHFLPDKIMFFAGIYNDDGACIVTRESYSKINQIHSRQPVLLKYDNFNTWFDKTHDFECQFSIEMNIYEVSKSVNSVKNNSFKNIQKVKN